MMIRFKFWWIFAIGILGTAPMIAIAQEIRDTTSRDDKDVAQVIDAQSKSGGIILKQNELDGLIADEGGGACPSAAGNTQPMIASVMSSGATPDASTAALMAVAASCGEVSETS